MDPPFCANGARRWAMRLGLDWAAFIRDGIEDSTLERTGDAMAIRIVEYVRKRNGQG